MTMRGQEVARSGPAQPDASAVVVGAPLEEALVNLRAGGRAVLELVRPVRAVRRLLTQGLALCWAVQHVVDDSCGRVRRLVVLGAREPTWEGEAGLVVADDDVDHGRVAAWVVAAAKVHALVDARRHRALVGHCCTHVERRDMHHCCGVSHVDDLHGTRHGGGEECTLGWRIAVSYTHLTLPTICSV